MKNVLIVIALISTILLVGCNKDNNIEINNESEIVQNQQQEETNNDVIENNNLLNNDYKLGDGYVLDDDIIEPAKYDFLFIADSENESDSYKFSSDDNDYTLKVTPNNRLLLNGNEILQNEYYESVGIIDLNTEDNYKELILASISDWDSIDKIYRIKANDELELIKEIWNSNLIKINGRYIYPNYLNFIKEKVLYGYQMYSGDSFVFVNRFLNSENIVDENGNLNSNFKSKEFTTMNTEFGGESENYSIYEDGKITDKRLKDNSKIKVLDIRSEVDNNNQYVGELIDLELVEDSVIYDNNNETQTSVKAGDRITLIVTHFG